MASPQGEAMLLLLKKAQGEADLFVILGDLFDIWLGKGEAFQKEYAPLLTEFKKLKSKCRILYFEGNHDFHLRKFWAEDMGFEVYENPLDFEYGGLKIHAEHGDEINRDDRGYLFLRWFLRTPVLKFLIEKVPSQVVFGIGHKASNKSRVYTSGLPNKTVPLFRSYAQDLNLRRPFDLFLVGHTHIPDDFNFVGQGQKFRLINLGSWFEKAHYLKVTSSGQIEDINL